MHRLVADMMNRSESIERSRRAFLRDGTLFLAGMGSTAFAAEVFAEVLSNRESVAPILRIGLVTDLHYADIETRGTRHYRDALEKTRRVVAAFNETGVDLAVQIGDLIDEGQDAETEASYLERVDGELAKLRAERHYVLGNHCIWTLTKEAFAAHSLDRKADRRTFYSFDRGGIHIVVLDACFRADETPYGERNNRWNDAEIPRAEREWLAKDLDATRLPVLVFIHQRLDVAGDYAARSAAKVRRILASSGKVIAVFQGHNHINDLREIAGIHFVTCDALIEGPASDPAANAYGVLSVLPGGVLRLEGFARQRSRSLPRLV